MVKRFATEPSLYDKYHKLYKEWGYVDDPTYSSHIGSHVCMTCSKFDYSNKYSFGAIHSCNRHQKLICHGQHLTHSCELYQKKLIYCYRKSSIIFLY